MSKIKCSNSPLLVFSEDDEIPIPECNEPQHPPTAYGAPAGTMPLPYRAADFYGTSEKRFTVVHTEEHMCQISITSRDVVTINPSPDPNAVFSDFLVNSILNGINGPSNLGNTGLPNVFKNYIGAMFLDQHREPLFITGFRQDQQNRYTICDLNSSAIGDFLGTAFNGTTGVWNVRFEVWATTPMCFGTWPGSPCILPTGRASIILNGLFPRDVQGNYPSDVYLRMQKVVNGKWIDYVPPNPIQFNAVDSRGLAKFVLTDLDPGSYYTAYIADITIYPSDSSTYRGYKQAIIEFVAANDTDSIFFWNNNQLDQPKRLCTFWTPIPAGDRRKIRFMTYSCCAGTYDGFKDAFLKPHHFQVGNGDNYYQDNAEVREDDPGNDFWQHYKAMLFVENYWSNLVAKAMFAQPDDHEVTDNANSIIAISPYNLAEFQLNNAENAFYNQLVAVPGNAKNIIFTRTNQFPRPPVPNERFIQAFDEFYKFFAAKPLTSTPEHNFKQRYGESEVILINSQVKINEDRSVSYYARRVDAAYPGTSPSDFTLLNEPNRLIPTSGYDYLKQALLQSTATVKFVFFSKNLSQIWDGHREEIRNEFFRMARLLNPAPSESLIQSTYDKLYRAFNYNNADGYFPQLDELLHFIRVNNIRNVFFFTGDPHVSFIEQLDVDQNVFNICTSAIATYRASGAPLLLSGNVDSKKFFMSLALNSYADVLFDPVANELYLHFWYGDEFRGAITLPVL